MLVLSRKKGDSIVIDGSIKLSVIEVRGNFVRLGVMAPRHVRVSRDEAAPSGQLTRHVRPLQARLASA